MSETTIMTVLEEIDRIRSADLHYWKVGQEQSRDARAEYHRRQRRLEEIRADRSAEFGVSPSESLQRRLVAVTATSPGDNRVLCAAISVDTFVRFY